MTPSNAPLVASYTSLLLGNPEVFDKLASVDVLEVARFLLVDNDLVWASFKKESSQEDYRASLHVIADHLNVHISHCSITQPPFDLLAMLTRVVLEMECLPDLMGLFKLEVEGELFKGLPSVRHPVSSIPPQQLESTFTTLRLSITTWTSRLHHFFLALLRSVTHKELVLEFFDKTLFTSLGRAKMRVTGEGLMGDSEAMLLWRLLMLFCEPIALQDDKAKLIVDDFWGGRTTIVHWQGLSKAPIVLSSPNLEGARHKVSPHQTSSAKSSLPPSLPPALVQSDLSPCSLTLKGMPIQSRTNSMQMSLTR